MAARIADVEVGFDTDRIARDLAASLAGALSEIAGALLGAAFPGDEDRPTEPQIIEWPLRSRPPRLIVRCPECDESVETTPLTWEIVLDPETHRLAGVRGTVEHLHDVDVSVRWGFVAEASEPAGPIHPVPPTDTIIMESAARTFARSQDDDDDLEAFETGQDRDDPFVFVPEAQGEPVTLRSAVFQALGAASVYGNESRAFESGWAAEIGEALLSLIDEKIEADERVNAWQQVANHRALRPAYGSGGPLLPSVLDHLTALDRAESERVRLDRIIYRARTALRDIVERRTYTPGPDAVADILAAVDGPDSPRSRELRENGR